MATTYGYMMTWTTYGSWLQGDKRGSIKKGKLIGPCKGLEQVNKDNQTGATVRLNRMQKEKVRKAIIERSLKAGERLLAISVHSNHVHVVLGCGGKKIGSVASELKNSAYFALKSEGHDGRVWTRGYDVRYCFDEKELQSRIEYVNRHEKSF